MGHLVSWIESRPRGAPRYPVYRYAVIYEDRSPSHHMTLKEAKKEAERETEGIRRWDRIEAEGTDRDYYYPVLGGPKLTPIDTNPGSEGEGGSP